MNSMLRAALAAQQRGFHIFPVAVNDKVPHRLAGQWGQTATNDVNRIVHFWTQVDPQANIGVACKPSQLLVIDLDEAKEDWNLRDTEWAYLHNGYGPRVSGMELFDEMAYKLYDEDGDADSYTFAYQVSTRSGGRHLYYQWPAHWPKISQASPVKGVVDVRGNGGQWGGYVLGAGSVVDGLYGVAEDLQIAPPPRWIRRLVAEKAKPLRTRPQGFNLGGINLGGSSFSGLVACVANAGQGNRNNTLLWAARTMCEEGAPVQKALEVLAPPAGDAGLGFQEIERTIHSAYRIQSHKEGR